jgi:sulfotransferase
MKQLHFISGLPRSGSTLLAGILRHPPQFHAAMSSPVAPMMNGALEQMGAGGEFSSFFDQDKRKRICRKNPFDYSRMYSPQSRQTVYASCEAQISASGAVGGAWKALKEAYYDEFSEYLLLLDRNLSPQKDRK